MSSPAAPRIALAPDPTPSWLEDAIVDGGGHLVPLVDSEAIVWADPRSPAALEDALEQAPDVRWVQLPFAGIENFIHLVDDKRVWTCGKGVYADPVAEMALALGLAGMRGLDAYARATSWTRPRGRNLLGARVTILGGGGIAESLVRQLQPWEGHIPVGRRNLREKDRGDDLRR